MQQGILQLHQRILQLACQVWIVAHVRTVSEGNPYRCLHLYSTLFHLTQEQQAIFYQISLWITLFVRGQRISSTKCSRKCCVFSLCLSWTGKGGEHYSSVLVSLFCFFIGWQVRQHQKGGHFEWCKNIITAYETLMYSFPHNTLLSMIMRQ